MIIGVDLGGTNVRIGKLIDGRVVEKLVEPSPAGLSLDESLDYMKALLSRVITPEVRGIGMGVPSVVDVERGIVYNVTNIPSWKEVHLKEILEKEFGIPVCINNDANCFALGEKRFGYGRDYNNVVGLTLGTGVGAGIIIGGELYNGANAGAGEIGSIPYLDGVYETYCSSDFFAMNGTRGSDVARKAAAGDTWALQLWDEFGGHMGRLMKAVLLAYDPEIVVFGGGLSGAYPLFERAMRAEMASFPFPKSLDRLKIAVSDNPDIAIMGAAALVRG